jgi:hypothetical protein
MATIVPPTVEVAVQPAPPGLLQARQAAGARVEAYLRSLGVCDRAALAEQVARIVEHTEAKYPGAGPHQLGRYAVSEAMRLRGQFTGALTRVNTPAVSQPPVPQRAPLQMPEQRIGSVPRLLRASFWRKLIHPVRFFLRPQLPPAGI